MYTPEYDVKSCNAYQYLVAKYVKIVTAISCRAVTVYHSIIIAAIRRFRLYRDILPL